MESRSNRERMLEGGFLVCFACSRRWRKLDSTSTLIQRKDRGDSEGAIVLVGREDGSRTVCGR